MCGARSSLQFGTGQCPHQLPKQTVGIYKQTARPAEGRSSLAGGGGPGGGKGGQEEGSRLSPLPPGSLLTTPHVESPEITPGICISMRFRSRIRNRRRVWGIFRHSFPLPLSAKGCLRALAEAVDTGGGQEGGGRCCQLCEVPGVASGWTTLQMETPRQEKGFFL